MWALQSALDNIDVLNRLSASNEAKAKEIGTALQELTEQLQKIPWQGRTDEAHLEENPTEDHGKTLQPLGKQLAAIRVSIAQFSVATVKATEEEARRCGAQLRWARLASMLLYVVGWGLGLATKLVTGGGE